MRKGQAALIVLLIMAAALTLGLATSRRVVVDTKIDKDEEMLKQAFNAAESGIETYLGTGSKNYQSTDGKSRANVTAIDIGGTTTITYDGLMAPNRPAVFWLAGHNLDKTVNFNNKFNGTNVDLCASATTGAVRVYYYYQDNSGFKVKRWMYNLSATKVQGITNATAANSSGITCPTGLTGVVSISTDNANVFPLMIVVVPVASATKLAVTSTANFPVQGETISSTGTVGDATQQAGAVRTVSQENRYDGGLLEYMLESLESNTNITN